MIHCMLPPDHQHITTPFIFHTLGANTGTHELKPWRPLPCDQSLPSMLFSLHLFSVNNAAGEQAPLLGQPRLCSILTIPSINKRSYTLYCKCRCMNTCTLATQAMLRVAAQRRGQAALPSAVPPQLPA